MGAAKIGLFRLATILHGKGALTDEELANVVEAAEIPHVLLSNYQSDRIAEKCQKEFEKKQFEEAKDAYLKAKAVTGFKTPS